MLTRLMKLRDRTKRKTFNKLSLLLLLKSIGAVNENLNFDIRVLQG